MMRPAVLKIVAKTRTEIEASLVMGRLAEAGIPCMRRGGGSGGSFARGGSILVEDKDLERARETLKADEGDFDEAELTRLSEEAAAKLAEQKPAEQEPPRHQPIQADDRDAADPPSRPPADSIEHGLLSAMERLIKRGGHEDGAPNPFGD